MKVLHIGKYYPPFFGGIEKVNFDLVEGLNNLDIKVDVICSNHEGKRDFVTKNKYEIFRVNSLGVIASTPISISFPKVLRRIQNDYDILHVHLPNPLANLALFLTRPKAKIILHWHSDIIKQKIFLQLYKPLQNWLLKRADKITTTSPNYISGSKYLLKYRDKTNYIPLGIDVNDFSINLDVVKRIKNDYPNKKIVFSLGRLIYYKGFEYLIESAKFINDDIIILIGGIGELNEKLRKQILDNNLDNKVKLIGKIPFDELGAYYLACDLFCLPSNEKSEAFGVVQIEAMAFGKPIVSTNINGSGVSWVNKNDYSGKVVEIESALEIANGINSVLSNKEDYEQLSKNCYNRYTALFTKKKMLKEFEMLYKMVLKT